MPHEDTPEQADRLMNSAGDDGPAALAREVERLTRAATVDRPSTFDLEDELPDHVVAQYTRPGDTLTLHDLERHLPRPVRARGGHTVFDVESFLAAVHRWGTPATTLWAHQPSTGAEKPTVVAVLNDAGGIATYDPDNAKALQGAPDEITPGWGDHRVTLEVRPDPDWTAWQLRDAGEAGVDPQRLLGRWMNQVTLAEFLHDQLPNIVEPSAADLIEAVTTFETRRTMNVQSAVQLDSGMVQFQWIEGEERNQKAGATDLPRTLKVRLRPFFGAPAADLTVNIRHRVSKDGGLTLGLFRHRPDLVEESAWSSWCAEIGAGVPGTPLMQGTAPDPVSPSR